MLLALLSFINAPEPGGAATDVALMTDARVRLVGLFVFPALVWLVSAPMVSVVENNLTHFLLERVTNTVFFVFDTLGIAIQKSGNVLQLPPSRWQNPTRSGVEHRRVRASVPSRPGSFAGSFLAAVFLEKLWKKILLVAMAVVLAFCTNILRGLFLTGWAYKYGSTAMESQVHDIAGYGILGLTVIGLLCLLPLLNLKISFGHGAKSHDPALPPALSLRRAARLAALPGAHEKTRRLPAPFQPSFRRDAAAAAETARNPARVAPGRERGRGAGDPADPRSAAGRRGGNLPDHDHQHRLRGGARALHPADRGLGYFPIDWWPFSRAPGPRSNPTW